MYGTEDHTHDNANILTTLNGQPYATYDANSNTLSGGGRTNTWDSQNRLVQCVYDGVTSAFTYGPDGLRRKIMPMASDTGSEVP